MLPQLFILKRCRAFVATALLTVGLALLSVSIGQQNDADSSSPQEPAVVLYYPMYQSRQAIDEASRKHVPIAWVYGSRADFQAKGEVAEGSSADLTQITFGYLGRMRRDLVIIAVMGKGGLNQLPRNLHDQFMIPDDGPPGDGDEDVKTPKVVITDSTGTVPLGRVSSSQLASMRETAIYYQVYSILHNPADLRILNNGGQDSPAVSQKPKPAIKIEAEDSQSMFLGFLWNVGEVFLLMLLVLGVILFAMGGNPPTPKAPTPNDSNHGKLKAK